MRVPSGEAVTPWLTSIPVISPTTLLVVGSMRWILSPALLVWIIRTFFGAAPNNVHRRTAAKTVRYRGNTCLFVIVDSFFEPANKENLRLRYRPLLPSQHPGLQYLPLRVVLRIELFASRVKE